MTIRISTRTIRISLVNDILSDESEVWNVQLGNLSLKAATENDAIELFNKLRDAIQDHTVDEVEG